MLAEDIRQRLRRMTSQAFQQDVDVPAAEDSRVGDLYHFGASRLPGVEWLAVEIDVAAGRYLLVAADSIPWVGTSDLSVTTGKAACRLSIRCDTGIWLDKKILREGRRSAGLGTRDLERVRRRRRRLQAGRAATAADEEEVDLDPDYVDWRRSLEVARRAVCRAFGGQLAEGCSAYDL